MSRLYNGTSAYKIDEYESYAHEAEKKRRASHAVHRAKREKENAAFCRFLIFAVAAVFAVCSAFIYTNVMILRASTEAEELKDELAVVTEKNSRKEMEISQKLDMKSIEEKAINELGMQRPDNSQIVYVDVKQASYSEVEKGTSAGKGILNSLKDVLGGVKEYFSK